MMSLIRAAVNYRVITNLLFAFDRIYVFMMGTTAMSIKQIAQVSVSEWEGNQSVDFQLHVYPHLGGCLCLTHSFINSD